MKKKPFDFVKFANSEKLKLEQTLYMIQEISGSAFIFEGKVTNPEVLSSKLTKYFKDKASYEFSIGDYRLSLEFKAPSNDSSMSSVLIDMSRGEMKLERKWHAISFSPKPKVAVHYQEIKHTFYIFRRALSDYSLFPEIKLSPRDSSLLKLVIEDRARKDNMMLPRWSSESSKKFNTLIDAGDVASLKKLLRHEYRNLRKKSFATLLLLFHKNGGDMLKNCRRIKKSLDPNISISDKLDKRIMRAYHARIGATESPAKAEPKVFLFVYEVLFNNDIEVFTEVLRRAGWENSLLIATSNYPAVHDFLDTNQIDFVFQGKLGMWHDKDLFDEELYYRKDADKWRGKVLRFESISPLQEEYVKNFLPEKLLNVS